jgi:F-box/TPR repeat protein Pof3
MKYSQDKIHSARLHKFSDRAGLRILATKCKSLANIEFLQTDFGGDSLIETAMIARNLKTLKISAATEINLDQITQILKHRPTLAQLEVDSMNPPGSAASWQVDLPGLQILKLCIKGREGPLNPSLMFLNLVSNKNDPKAVLRC